MTDIIIASAARTPIGAFSGTLSPLPAHVLGENAIREALKRATVEPGDVSEVIMGQILTAGAGMNPARQAALAVGVPAERTAYMVNQVCGSGLRSIALGMQAIQLGESDVVVAGGQESMSNAPHYIHMRNGVKMGDAQLVDTMIKDGLWCAINGYHMGTTAENVAKRWQLTRDEQDEFAAASQQKAEAAQKDGKFKDEIVPITIKGRKGDTVMEDDEYPRAGTTSESLSKLRPAFDKEGTVTAGNASGINDGAAADAKCRQSFFGVALLHFMEQCHHDTCAGCTDRMAESDGAAVDVNFSRVPTEVFVYGQSLRGKSFIGFNQVEIIDVPSGFFQSGLAGRYGPGAHDIGFDTGRRPTGDAS